jgi:hypothetical protein
MKRALLTAGAYLLLCFCIVSCSNFPTGEVQGTIISIGQINLEPDLLCQAVLWESDKSSRMISVDWTLFGAGDQYFKKSNWYFVEKKITDSLIGKKVKIRYKIIDPEQGIFYPISVETIP